MSDRKASAPNLVATVTVRHMQALIAEVGLEPFLLSLVDSIENDFRRWHEFDKSPRVAAHARAGVIELMPVSDRRQFAFKYVNGHPENPARRLQTVTAFGALADMNTGYPILISEMTLLTALRTAATSAMVARQLISGPGHRMALIGNGAQSEFQAVAFRAALGVNQLRLYDVDVQASRKCRHNLQALGFDVTVCKSVQHAVESADIITTVTADKRRARVLSPEMIRPGVYINAVGGDCPGKTELDKAILENARIIIEYEPQTRLEGEIQQLPPDWPVTEFWSVLAGNPPVRASKTEVTVFDSVGFALEDFSAMRLLHSLLQRYPHFEFLDLLACPDDPKNLFGLLAANPVRRHSHTEIAALQRRGTLAA